MGDRSGGHDFRVRQEEAGAQGLRGRALQVQHGAESADHREDRVQIRIYPHRLRTSGNFILTTSFLIQ